MKRIPFLQRGNRIKTVRRGFVLAILLGLTGSGLAFGQEDGFKSIFNGRDLTGWEGDPRLWSVKDGVLTGQTTAENPTKQNTFLIWRAGEVDDFELRLSFRIPSGNSGVQYRSQESDNWRVGGYQADMEAGPNWTGGFYEERGRGILAIRGQKTVLAENGEKTTEEFAKSEDLFKLIKKDDWNEMVIIARGPRLTHKVNGHLMCEVIDNETAKRAQSGILAFQVHAGPPMMVQYKDIRLKRFPLADKKKAVLVAGRASHGRGSHEHNAGVLLLKSCLDSQPEVLPAVYLDGWPNDPTAFDNADSILLFMDGGGGHPMLRGERLKQIGERMKQGAGLAIIHYAVDVPKDRGGSEMLDWIGGYYEAGYSTNPIWEANFESLAEHPITRGIKPFTMRDEWYFSIRFREGMKGVTPILKATPPDSARGTDAARAHPGRAEVVAWCVERPDGGRGFGFTGGHFHTAWGDANYRTVVLNAILWTAGLEVPAGGVSSSVTDEMLKQNIDQDRPR